MYTRDRLEAFIAFAEHQSFTRAARALHLSQPALFAQIGKLESELGVSIYRRRGRNVELTEAGQQALAFARDMRERIERFEAELRGETVGAPVVLSAGRGSYLYLLGPAIRQFRKRAQWSLSTLVLGRDDTIEAVVGGRAHVGVTAALSRVPEEVRATPIVEVMPQLALLKGHRLAKRKRLSLSDLSGETLIAPPLGRAHREKLEAALRDAEVDSRVEIEADGWDLMLHFVSLGLGLAVINDGCRLPRGVVTRPLSGLPGVRYVMLTRPNTAHPGAQQLAGAIVAQCSTVT